MAKQPTAQPTDEEIDELVSHVLALRKDFVQELLAEAQLTRAERDQPKAALRDVLRAAIESRRLTVERVAAFLDRQEPGGKQHAFILRPKKAYNDRWRDSAKVLRSLRRRPAVRALLDAPTPLVMPEELELSSVSVGDDGIVEIVAVEARRYFERDESYDDTTRSEEGLPVELRAYVERVARSTVVMRWDVNTRHAALHITQATSRGVGRNHYSDVAERFADAVAPWLDYSQFQPVDLHKVIHELQRLEQGTTALTRSRRGRWETDDGSEIEAISSSTAASLFADKRVAAAVGQVSDADSGRTGNLYWLNTDGNPLKEPLHITIVASDSRVNFMQPSSPEAVTYVIEQIRSLL